MSSSSVPVGASFGGPLPYTPGSITTPQFNGFPLSMNLGTVALLGVDGLTSRAAFLTMQAALNTRGFANGLAGLDVNARVPVAQIPVGIANGVAGLDANNQVPVAQVPTTLNATTLPKVTLTGTGSTGDITGMNAGAVSGVTPTSYPAPALGKITRGQAPIYDMFFTRDGVTPDEPGINAMLSDYNACRVLPDQVGGRPSVYVKNSPIVIPTNGRLSGLAGKQRTWINRDVNFSGDTVQMGAVAGGAGAGTAVIEGFWFNHPGRFQGVVPTAFALTNRLTAGQAHIRASGVQGAGIYDCGGWGMPHFIVHSGGSGLDIVRPFVIGGMWNPLIAAQQESIDVFNSVYDPNYGYSVNCNIVGPNFIGGNTAAASRVVPLDTKTFTVTNPRIGPRWCYQLQCYEVFKVSGGFSGGYAEANFHFEPGGPAIINGIPAWVMIRAMITDHVIDESLVAGVQFARSLDTTAVATDVRFQGCNFNGQLVGARGIVTTQNGKFAVANLVVAGGTFGAYQGGAILLYGVDGGLIAPDRVRGYNYCGSNTASGDALATGAGIYVGDVTRNVKVMWPVFGGGANYDTDPNSCQWGFGDVTPVSNGVSTQGNKYYGLDAVNLGLAGGGAVIGGQKFTP